MNIKSTDDAIIKIKQYITKKSDFKKALIVNVNNKEDYMAMKSNSISDEFEIINLSKYAGENKDGIPDMETCFSDIRNVKQNSLVLGLSQHMKIIGEDALDMCINNILALKGDGPKVVVLVDNLEQKLQRLLSEDKRLESSILLVKGIKAYSCKLYLVSEKLNHVGNKSVIDGYATYLKECENNYLNSAIVSSSISKTDFSKSVLDIEVIKDGFNLLYTLCDLPPNFVASMGPDEYWTKLCEDIGRTDIYDYLECRFGDLGNLYNSLYLWEEWDDYEKWLFYIGLKIGRANHDHEYLSYVMQQSICYEVFSGKLFDALLDFDYTDKNFDKFYLQRRKIVKHIKNLDLTNNYLDMVKLKGNSKIYYLTDLTSIEREEIIDWLSNQNIIDEKVKKILALIYEDLHLYLQFFNMKNDSFNEYFLSYKLQKLNNKIYDGFNDLVNKYAKTREYNKLIPTRNEVFEKIDKSNSTIYFIDALGVEFLGYICSLCNSIGLSVEVTLTKANIPTTTFANKDFLDGLVYQDIKALDKLKHSGENNYNYEFTKLPLHIPEELRLIKEIIYKIKAELSKKLKAIIVSDHGASRLVVINEKKVSFDVQSNGTQGGRCCKYVEGMQEVEFATRENGQYVLANYDRFKTCGAPRVETHGGATLEELFVPVIVITNANNKVTATPVENIIQSSFRVKAELRIYVTKSFDKILVRINNKDYPSSSFDGNYFIVPIHDITKSGKYDAGVYCDDNHIDDITFTIKKSETKERDFGI